jgi:hypothetical protein
MRMREGRHQRPGFIQLIVAEFDDSHLLRWAQDHQLVRIWEGDEADLRVDLMRIKGGQEHPLEPVGSQVVTDRRGQPGAETYAAVRGGDIDIAQPGEGRKIGDDACVCNLSTAGVVDAEVERRADGLLDCFAAAAQSPERVSRKPVVHQADVETVWGSIDLISIFSMIDHDCAW